MRSLSSDGLSGRPLLGQIGEALAAEYLIRAGYVIVERNYRCTAGEIDLIARDAATLVFVEVRTRSRPDFGHPLESIDYRKQCRLRRLAARYLEERGTAVASLRFDAVGILIPLSGEPSIELVKNAFGRGVS